MGAHNTDLNAPAWTVIFYQQKIKSQLYSLPKTTAVVRRTSVQDSSSTLWTTSNSISQRQRHSIPSELSAKGKKRERSLGRDGSPTYLRPSKKRCRKYDNEYVIYFHSGHTPIKEPTRIDPAYDPPLGTTYIYQVENNTIVGEKEPRVQIWIHCMGGHGKLMWKRCLKEEDVRLPGFGEVRLSINQKKNPGWVLPLTAQRKENSYRLVIKDIRK